MGDVVEQGLLMGKSADERTNAGGGDNGKRGRKAVI